jgi:hypothetical protein
VTGIGALIHDFISVGGRQIRKLFYPKAGPQSFEGYFIPVLEPDFNQLLARIAHDFLKKTFD